MKMKKNFKLENLDCANCATKMETAINKIDGAQATISFMSQKLTFEADEAQFDDLLDQAQKAMRKIERDCVIVR